MCSFRGLQAPSASVPSFRARHRRNEYLKGQHATIGVLPLRPPQPTTTTSPACPSPIPASKETVNPDPGNFSVRSIVSETLRQMNVVAVDVDSTQHSTAKRSKGSAPRKGKDKVEKLSSSDDKGWKVRAYDHSSPENQT